MAEKPNPEKRSNTAMWCMAAGAALLGLSYVLGIPAIIAAAASNGDPVAIAGSATGLALVVASGVIGGLLVLTGVIWSFVQVIADSRGEHANERYKDVER